MLFTIPFHPTSRSPPVKVTRDRLFVEKDIVVLYTFGCGLAFRYLANEELISRKEFCDYFLYTLNEINKCCYAQCCFFGLYSRSRNCPHFKTIRDEIFWAVSRSQSQRGFKSQSWAKKVHLRKTTVMPKVSSNSRNVYPFIRRIMELNSKAKCHFFICNCITIITEICFSETKNTEYLQQVGERV